MSTFNNPPVNEGDALTAASINAKAGTDLETPVNDLEESSIERHALDAPHLPSFSMSDIFSNGYEAGDGITAITAESYGNTLPLSVGPAYPYTYQTFDATAGSAVAIGYYGPVATSITNGWRIPAYQNNTSVAAEVTLASATNFTTAEIKGVICEGSIEPYLANDAAADGSTRATIRPGLVCLAMAIGWEDGAGNRHVVERSVRFYSVRAVQQGNCSTATFLTPTDLADGDNTCAKIFMVVASVRPGATTTNLRDYTGSATASDDLEIQHYNISVLPLKAGDL